MNFGSPWSQYQKHDDEAGECQAQAGCSLCADNREHAFCQQAPDWIEAMAMSSKPTGNSVATKLWGALSLIGVPGRRFKDRHDAWVILDVQYSAHSIWIFCL